MMEIPNDLSGLEELQRTAAAEGWSAGESNAIAANKNAEPGALYLPGPSDGQLDAALQQMSGLKYDTEADRQRAFQTIEAMRGSIFRVDFRDDGTWTHRLEPRA